MDSSERFELFIYIYTYYMYIAVYKSDNMIAFVYLTFII